MDKRDVSNLHGMAQSVDLLDLQRSMTGLTVDNPKVGRALETMEPLRTAAAFGALLTVPELQSNCVRLEMLAHQALALGKGGKKPNAQGIANQFRESGGGKAGRLEDPAEDVFVAYVRTAQGGYRVLEGIWESAGFYAQRFVNVIESMPPAPQFNRIRDSVYALLQLSELVCDRAGLDRYQLGGAVPRETIPKLLLDRLPSIKRRSWFTRADLEAEGIAIDALQPFIFNPSQRKVLLKESLGHSPLERRPLAMDGDDLVVVLPTAVTAALRRYVIETVRALGVHEAFLANLGRDYTRLIESLPLFSDWTGADLHFHRSESLALAGAATSVDQGRYLNLLLILDPLDGFDGEGLVGRNPDNPQAGAQIAHWVADVQASARQQPGFVDGLTLLVICGVGRSVGFSLPPLEAADWRVQLISAADLATLGWTDGFDALTFWRLLDTKDATEHAGVSVQNINGILNLVAWARSQGGQMVPDGDLPDDFADGERHSLLMVPQTGLRDLRHEVATDYDLHMQRDVEGVLHSVRRLKDRLFEEDDTYPIYVSETPRERRGAAGVFLTAERSWWFDVIVPEDLPAGQSHDNWLMLMYWLVRGAPVLEQAFPKVPLGPLLIEADFRAAGRPELSGECDYESAREGLAVVVDVERRRIQLTISPAFEAAFHHVDNIAEQALIGAIASGVAALAGVQIDASRERGLIAEIAPDPMARHRHTFTASKYLDRVREDLLHNVVVVNDHDQALLKLGLGWKNHDRRLGPWIRGKADCTAFLNATVTTLETELCEELRGFERKALLLALLYNHETVASENQRWKRTAGAILAMRQDKAAVRAIINAQTSERGEVSQTSRALMELALCECPLGAGRLPGNLDLSRLMSKMGLLHILSGWSSAIRWDVMEPTLKISPVGYPLGKLGFLDEVIAPFSQAFTDVTVESAIKRYAKNYAEVEVTPTVEASEDQKFYRALEGEWGAKFDDYRQFLDRVENLGDAAGKVVLTVRRSELVALRNSGSPISLDAIETIINTLTLAPRAGWRSLGTDIDPRDLELWRYRRRSSPLRRPLIQLDGGADPLMLVAPGMLRQGVLYSVSNFFEGGFPDWQLGKPMRSWQGKVADKRGRAFTISIGELLKANGWKVAEPDLKITKLLNLGFDRDHGDIDVLAWRADQKRVLVIECKDLQFRKNLGEISEQLSDFRGEVVDGKSDYLRKHLDRIDLLRAHLPQIATFVGWDAVSDIESHLTFKNPVPMQFALAKMQERVTVSTSATILATLEGGDGARSQKAKLDEA